MAKQINLNFDTNAAAVAESYAKNFGYLETVKNAPNPETKLQFAARKIAELIVEDEYQFRKFFADGSAVVVRGAPPMITTTATAIKLEFPDTQANNIAASQSVGRTTTMANGAANTATMLETAVAKQADQIVNIVFEQQKKDSPGSATITKIAAPTTSITSV